MPSSSRWPNAKRLRFVVVGAALGAVAWVLATWIGLYVAAFGHYNVTYGSLGGLVILLTCSTCRGSSLWPAAS